jgi:hypothetical protein
MTNEERVADSALNEAKRNVKEAFAILDPAPRDPLAKALLKVLDTIDDARRKLKNRL